MGGSPSSVAPPLSHPINPRSFLVPVNINQVLPCQRKTYGHKIAWFGLGRRV